MAASIFALLDDIAALMDDVAIAAKVATKKTAGILGDDLAVNAEKATGFLSTREIPVLWQITKGSFLNKLIIVPIVFLLQWILPQAITYILLIGGFYLAYEGVEKIIHTIQHRRNPKPAIEQKEELTSAELDAQEKAKIKSAVVTDFILSVEIVIIALSTVINKPLNLQIITVAIVAIVATVGVYGVVALIVRMDDAGYKILKRSKNEGIGALVGKGLVRGLPVIIQILAVVGTLALLLVSGGIFSHNLHFVHELWATWPSMIKEFVLGLIAGTLVWLVLLPIKKLVGKKEAAQQN